MATILVIDDEPTILRVLSGSGALRGYDGPSLRMMVSQVSLSYRRTTDKHQYTTQRLLEMTILEWRGRKETFRRIRTITAPTRV